MTAVNKLAGELANPRYWQYTVPAEAQDIPWIDRPGSFLGGSPQTMHRVARGAAGIAMGPSLTESVADGELLPMPSRALLDDGGFEELVRVDLHTRWTGPLSQLEVFLDTPPKTYQYILAPEDAEEGRLDDRSYQAFNIDPATGEGQWLGRKVLYLTASRSGTSLVGLGSSDAAEVARATDWPANRIASKAVFLPRLTVDRRHTVARKDGTRLDTIVSSAQMLKRRQPLSDFVLRQLTQVV
jgi:hypothetical protein